MFWLYSSSFLFSEEENLYYKVLYSFTQILEHFDRLHAEMSVLYVDVVTVDRVLINSP